ncbi:hypothetical protein HK101_000617 [Irineochytrium annulatum]|nr:hypothetical protein HK101_000617 [Irineochytrium annulatum]
MGAPRPQRPPSTQDFPGLGQPAQRPAAPQSVEQQPEAPAPRQQAEASAPAPARPPAPTVDEVAFELDQSLVMFDRVRPARPQRGKLGKPIKLLTNFYGMTIPGSDCYHYETLPPVNRRIMEVWKSTNGSNPAKLGVYDGRKNFYTPKKIVFKDDGVQALKIVLPEEDPSEQKREQSFTVTVRLVATVNMEKLHRFIEGKGDNDAPREAIQILDILLKSRPTMLFMSINKRTGGSFYDDHAPTFISGGLAAHQGWKQSIRPTYKQLLVNLDVATSCYYQTGPMLDVVAGFFGRRGILDVINDQRLAQKLYNPQTLEFQRLSKFLSRVSIDITHRDSGRRKYKVKKLHKFGADRTEITVDSMAKSMSVAKYFGEVLGKRVQYPQLPLVCCGTDGQIMIPMEFCMIRPNQRHIGKLSEAQTADIIKVTAVPPPERRQRIERGRSTMHDEKQNVDLLAAWGVKLDPNMKEVDARILPAPVLTGSSQRGSPDINPFNGAFDFSKVPQQFYRPASLKAYGVCVFGQTRTTWDQLCGFLDALFKGCRDKGMQIEKRDYNDIVLYQERREVQAALAEVNHMAVKAAMPPGATNLPPTAQMIFCVFDKGGALYDEIKHVAETKLNIMTQCFLAKHCFNTKPGVAVNLALKINAKLGGVNCVVEPSKHLSVLGQPIPTMIMGADVTHPPPGADGGVSIAAVVASLDSRFCEYRAAIRVQPPRTEIIKSLGDVSIELMNLFRARANNRFPQRVLFFRDGVSEGQFGEVALQEVQSLKKAFRDLGANDIKLTFLVVNKRHGARFFAKDGRDADKKGNVLAGTVVDSGITHPFEFDFYLNSHQGLQGTSRSAHYHVLYDENNFTADSLQEITYKMCYLYARASRSVSIVPPAYYAHLVAARARCYRVGGVNGSDTISMSGGIGSATAEQFSEVTVGMKNKINTKRNSDLALKSVDGVGHLSLADFRLLNMGWAVADAALITGQIVREEPEAMCTVKFPDILEYRTKILGLPKNPINLILTETCDMDFTRPIFRCTELQVVVLTTKEAIEVGVSRFLKSREDPSCMNTSVMRSWKPGEAVELANGTVTFVSFERGEDGRLDLFEVIEWVSTTLGVKRLEISAGGIIINNLINNCLLDEIRLTQTGQFVGRVGFNF